jgi:hypothetical protein
MQFSFQTASISNIRAAIAQGDFTLAGDLAALSAYDVARQELKEREAEMAAIREEINQGNYGRAGKLESLKAVLDEARAQAAAAVATNGGGAVDRGCSSTPGRVSTPLDTEKFADSSIADLQASISNIRAAIAQGDFTRAGDLAALGAQLQECKNVAAAARQELKEREAEMAAIREEINQGNYSRAGKLESLKAELDEARALAEAAVAMDGGGAVGGSFATLRSLAPPALALPAPQSSTPLALPAHNLTPVQIQIFHDAENCYFGNQELDIVGIHGAVVAEVQRVAQLPRAVLGKWRLYLPLLDPNRVRQHPSQRSMTALQNRGIDYICCPPKRDAVDTKLKDGLAEFVRTNRSQPSQHLVVVLSGDRDFTGSLREAAAEGFDTFLFHSGHLSAGVAANAAYQSGRWAEIVESHKMHASGGASHTARLSPSSSKHSPSFNTPPFPSNTQHKKCPNCSFMTNSDPLYRQRKPRKLWPFCCNACASSDGSKHGVLCQRTLAPLASALPTTGHRMRSPSKKTQRQKVQQPTLHLEDMLQMLTSTGGEFEFSPQQSANHKVKPSTGAPKVCLHYAEWGSCDFGDECHFQHPGKPGVGMAGRRLCDNWKESGYCSYGSTCRFAHPAVCKHPNCSGSNKNGMKCTFFHPHP